jgi:hypothetical protein
MALRFDGCSIDRGVPRAPLIAGDRNFDSRTLTRFGILDASDGDRRRLPEFLVNLPVHGIFRLSSEMTMAVGDGRRGVPLTGSTPGLALARNPFSDNSQVPSFSVRGMFS